jgi:uncharacterized repeat protein (TIGR03803 family)
MKTRIRIPLSEPATPLRGVVGLLIGVVTFLAAGTQVQAQSYSVVYSFQCGPNDGSGPYGDLIADSVGNLYGTTQFGGSSATPETLGYGTVFEVSATGTEAVLHSFAGPPTDGSQPYAGLVRDAAGNLYGTTAYGGAYDYGTVFEVAASGAETILHSFTGGKDEAQPLGNLLLDSSGNLYGTAAGEFTGQFGTVFRLAPSGKIMELYTFAGTPNDGSFPRSGLIHDGAAGLYGTTEGGGLYLSGTVFELNKAGPDTILYNFTGESDGGGPAANLIHDAAGNLYGTTIEGGNTPAGCDFDTYFGCGTVFKVTPGGQETVLYAFTGGADGGVPFSDLVMDSKGNLYGTASIGGISNNELCAGDGEPVCGVVFQVSAAGKEKVLHSFTGVPDGSQPYGGLLRLGNNLYGTTYIGGTEQCGTVYRVTP